MEKYGRNHCCIKNYAKMRRVVNMNAELNIMLQGNAMVFFKNYCKVTGKFRIMFDGKEILDLTVQLLLVWFGSRSSFNQFMAKRV